jgi:hypothetical protein
MLHQRQRCQIGILMHKPQRAGCDCPRPARICQLHDSEILALPLQRHAQDRPALAAATVFPARLVIVGAIHELRQRSAQRVPRQTGAIERVRRVRGRGSRIPRHRRDALPRIQEVHHSLIRAQHLTAELEHRFGQSRLAQPRQQPFRCIQP